MLMNPLPPYLHPYSRPFTLTMDHLPILWTLYLYNRSFTHTVDPLPIQLTLYPYNGPFTYAVCGLVYTQWTIYLYNGPLTLSPIQWIPLQWTLYLCVDTLTIDLLFIQWTMYCTLHDCYVHKVEKRYFVGLCCGYSRFLDSSCCLSHWSVESGDVDLVTGQGHTNCVATIEATPDKLYSLGLDKSLKSFLASTNEFE